MIGTQIYFLLTFPALSGAYAIGHSGLLGQNVHQPNCALRINGGMARENLKSHHDEAVASQNRKRLAISTVKGGFAPPRFGIVKAWQIIMHQRGAVNTFQSGRGCIGQFRAIITAGRGDTH